MQLSYSKVEDTAKALSRSLFDIEILFGYMFGNMQFSVKIFLLQCNLDTCYIYIYEEFEEKYEEFENKIWRNTSIHSVIPLFTMNESINK